MPADPKYLREFSCFSNLSDAHVADIARIATAVCYPPGYTLMEEGKPGDRLFFLIRGKVEVFYNIGEAGQVRVDAVSGDEVIGCSALVPTYVYTATERCVTEAEVFEIDLVALRELMQKDHNLGFAIQEHLIGVLMNRIIDLRLQVA